MAMALVKIENAISEPGQHVCSTGGDGLNWVMIIVRLLKIFFDANVHLQKRKN